MENKSESKAFKITMAIIPIIISFCALLGSIIMPIVLQKDNQNLDEELRIKAAIPAFRVVHNKQADDIMEIFPPHRQPKFIQDAYGNSVKEIYYTIKDFSVQNLSNNLAYFSHIEFAGEAFELVNLGLVAKENEVISLSNDNRFVGYGPQSKFYIMCRSIYDRYYSYECLLNSDGLIDGVYTFSVDYIGVAEEYDINNDVYKNMYKHVRDIQVFPPSIIF